MKLRIGGTEPADGWTILNIQPGPDVGIVGNCSDLCDFADGTMETIYASHVLEHVSHRGELDKTLGEWARVLVPGGQVMIGVPDMDAPISPDRASATP